jgi:DNA (cytosine-5)-methyltransferase 1
MKIRLLDLFCGAGGATLGYLRHAGVQVTGVDIKPQKHHPAEFIQADALNYLREHYMEYDFIHASPPCTEYSQARGKRILPPDNALIDTLTFLRACGRPYVVENVPYASRYMNNPVWLTGSMFGLSVYKKRCFECSFVVRQPTEPPKQNRLPLTPLCGLYWDEKDRSKGAVTCEEYSKAMGLPIWTQKELRNALPPSYTEFLFVEYLSSIGDTFEY